MCVYIMLPYTVLALNLLMFLLQSLSRSHRVSNRLMSLQQFRAWTLKPSYHLRGGRRGLRLHVERFKQKAKMLWSSPQAEVGGEVEVSKDYLILCLCAFSCCGFQNVCCCVKGFWETCCCFWGCPSVGVTELQCSAATSRRLSGSIHLQDHITSWPYVSYWLLINIFTLWKLRLKTPNSKNTWLCFTTMPPSFRSMFQVSIWRASC